MTNFALCRLVYQLMQKRGRTNLSTLSIELNDHITSQKGFIIPELTTFTIKALQLDTLRIVWTYTSKGYSTLKKQKERTTQIIRSLNQNSNQTHGQQYSTSGQDFNNYEEHQLVVHWNDKISHNQNDYDQNFQNPRGQSHIQNIPSLAKTTIVREHGNTPTYLPQVQPKPHPKIGLQHPFNQNKKI